MIEFNSYNAVIVLVGISSLYCVLKFLSHQRKEGIWKKWAEKSKNKVILHGLYGGRKVPTPSPFVLKVETYLRMAKIPYDLDKSDIWGPKGKTPWISVNGQHVSDSQHILEFLGKKFDKTCDTIYSDEQKSIGTAVRIMMEEYVYWCTILWRFAFSGRDTFAKVKKGEISFGEWMIFSMIAPSLKSAAWTQGLGRHSEAEVISIMEKCLRSLSKIMNNKLFLLGNEPCEYDCAVFGQLAAIVFTDNSPFEKLIDGELKNLKAYCIRMKEEFWPDWDELLKR